MVSYIPLLFVRINQGNKVGKILFGFLILIGLASTTLQGHAATIKQAATPEATSTTAEVKIKMADGLEIQGTFYASAKGTKAPAVLLVHQNNGSRQQWDKLVPGLISAGYNILAVDQRGFGKTGGARDYLLLEKDDVEMMNWLRIQETVDGDRVAIIGASVGSNGALRACAADEKCKVVIALSPGVSFYGVEPKDAIKEMKKKNVLLLASQRDAESAQAVKSFLLVVSDESTAMVKVYGNTGLHGTDLLLLPDVSPLIVDWLETYNK